jgi:hypothetical protein
MKVNIKKTKIIIFNKAGRTIKKKFLFANEEVECISNYKYLDIHFTASGTFTIAKHELCKKALKAFFKLRKDFLSLNPGRKTCINVFDHTIKPMLLYGSEVWGVFNVTSANLSRTDDIHLNDCYRYFQGETLHLKFCKSILGLNRKSVNHASLSELCIMILLKLYCNIAID